MDNSNKIDTSAKRTNLLTYLNLGKFEIPIYQRKFVWNKDQAIEFMGELYSTFEDEYKNNLSLEMFVGSIYVSWNTQGNNWEIIDGQQRTIFFYCLKYFFLQNKTFSIDILIEKYQNYIKDNSDYERDKDKLLLEDIKEIRERLEGFKITSVSEEFEKRFNNRTGNIQRRLENISESLEKYLYDDCINGNLNFNGIIKIFSFIKFTFTNISLIEIQTKPIDDINEIFKSINSKGRALNQWDLIRNEIYKNIIATHGTNKVDAMKKLQKIDDNLKYFCEKWFISPEEFIWSYIIFKNEEYISKKSLSKEFTRLLNEEKIDLKVMISDIDIFYKTLDKYDNTVNIFKWFLYICKEIRAIQIKIVILTCFMSDNFENYNLWVEKLLINFIVFVSMSGKRSNFFEKFFKQSNTIKIFLSNNEYDINKLIELQEFFIDNKQLPREDIELNLIEAKKMIKVYIFLKTPIDQRNKIFPMLNYEYEHVLPQSYDLWQTAYPFWNNLNDEDIDNYIEKIGNFILLNKELNKVASNKLLEDKFKEYFNNDLKAQYSIFTKGLNLNHSSFQFLSPIFGDFQNGDIQNENEIPQVPIFSPNLIDKRTREISSAIATLFMEKL